MKNSETKIVEKELSKPINLDIQNLTDSVGKTIENFSPHIRAQYIVELEIQEEAIDFDVKNMKLRKDPAKASIKFTPVNSDAQPTKRVAPISLPYRGNS